MHQNRIRDRGNTLESRLAAVEGELSVLTSLLERMGVDVDALFAVEANAGVHWRETVCACLKAQIDQAALRQLGLSVPALEEMEKILQRILPRGKSCSEDAPNAEMTAVQLDVVAELLRSRDPVRAAASLALVEGKSNPEVSEATGMSPQAVSNALTRYRVAHHKILVAYAPQR